MENRCKVTQSSTVVESGTSFSSAMVSTVNIIVLYTLLSALFCQKAVFFHVHVGIHQS